MIYLDASFWIAFRARGEPEHPTAVQIARALGQRQATLTTTALVFAEVQAYFSRNPRLKEQVINDFWGSPVIKFHDFTYNEQKAAVGLLRHHSDKDYSFCDALSFVVMQKLGIETVLTFDQHFRQFGQFRVIDHV